MLIIYFLLGLGITTAHSDYGVSSRAKNFDKTVQNIDKEAYIKHQREKRFVAGYFVPQNLTNKPTWGNLHITRNPMTFTGPSNTTQNANEQIFGNNGTLPNNNLIVIYPVKNTTGLSLIKPGPYGNMTDVTGKYVNQEQNYNTNATWPVYPTYNYIKVIPGYNINGNNTSNASGYNVPVNSVTPRNTPYPGYPGYPAPNSGYPVPNTGYPSPNTGYPAQNTGYPAQNTGYPAPTNVNSPVYPNYNNVIVRPVNKNNFNNSDPSGYYVQPVNTVTPGNTPYYPVPNTGYPSNTGNPAPNTRYPVPNNGYPASDTVYPAPNSGYRAPNTGYPTSSGYPVPNTTYPSNTGNTAPNTRYPVPNNGYPASNTFYPAPDSGYRAPNTGYPASSGYPVPNTGYPVPYPCVPAASSGYPVPDNCHPTPSSVIPPANVTGFAPKPNPGFTIHDAVPRNSTNRFNNNGNGFNNTASWENCKCKLPRANSNITKEESAMDACMIACNNCPAGMKMSAFGVCVKDLDYDDE